MDGTAAPTIALACTLYATHKDKTEREKYLKDYHGEYSGHSGGNDNLTHTRGKGIEFSHGSITAPMPRSR